MVNVNIEVPDDLHKRLKLTAAEEETTLKELFTQLLSDDGQH